MSVTRADLLGILKKAVPFLKEPDHSGEFTTDKRSGEPKSVPLHRNDCACDLHRFHVSIRKVIARAEGKK